jgi:hypothetical protein
VIVYTFDRSPAEVTVGQCIVSGGWARRVVELRGIRCGYHRFGVERYDAEHHVVTGELEVRQDTTVKVVAQLPDGALLVA